MDRPRASPFDGAAAIELLGVPRSTFYCQPRPESPENLRLLRKLDELYLDYPFFGSRRMAVKLEAGRTRTRRLMHVLGIEAHYPKRNLSRPAPGHEIYPYLLRGVSIERPNQVWRYLFTALNPNKIGHSNKGLNKSPRFV